MEPLSASAALVLASLCTPALHKQVLVLKLMHQVPRTLAAVSVLLPEPFFVAGKWHVMLRGYGQRGYRDYRLVSDKRPPPPDSLDVNYRIPDLGCEISTG